MRRRTVSAIGAVIAAGAAVGLLSFDTAHARAAAASPAASPPSRQAASRLFLSSDQLREARKAGLIDRPIKSLLDVRQPMEYGEFLWDERGVPPGHAWVRVDLGSQLISVFRSGHEIGTAVILYGADGLPTPTGKFPILSKTRNHRSRTYNNAPMPYSLWLTRDGVAIHGSNVRWGFATHGCVGVPTAFAAKLFASLTVGDDVLIVPAKARSRKI